MGPYALRIFLHKEAATYSVTGFRHPSAVINERDKFVNGEADEHGRYGKNPHRDLLVLTNFHFLNPAFQNCGDATAARWRLTNP